MRVLAITYAIAVALTLVSASPLPVEDDVLVSRGAVQCGEVGSEQYCKGIVFSDAQYLCGDWRLGPAMLPRMGPITRVVASWQRFGDLCPAEFIEKWTQPDGSWKLPYFKGFMVDDKTGLMLAKEVDLKIGTRLDRFGGEEQGRYLADEKTPYAARSIPPSNLNTYKDAKDHPNNYYLYEVSKEFKALAGPTAPYYGQKGKGMQYYVPETVAFLLKNGYLRRVRI
ncbi:hypothetical protein HGRIS_012629 [Hohenbuehelia grisea]|uniref:TNT domain-containing protein n=1 Tax=Hohenbuehelia grisea TaxID=104357 RepID=A0ABR3IT24_9AGAR